MRETRDVSISTKHNQDYTMDDTMAATTEEINCRPWQKGHKNRKTEKQTSEGSHSAREKQKSRLHRNQKRTRNIKNSGKKENITEHTGSSKSQTTEKPQHTRGAGDLKRRTTWMQVLCLFIVSPDWRPSVRSAWSWASPGKCLHSRGLPQSRAMPLNTQ